MQIYSKMDEAQDIAQRAAQAAYTRFYNSNIRAGIDQPIAKEWASEDAALVYDEEFDAAVIRLHR